MESFRTELEKIPNKAGKVLIEKDIIDLDRKIRAFREGSIHEEKFRSLRLARGVYGQRQQGVQMVRIKLPFGRLSAKQLLRIADISDEYSHGNLHLTTRQDIQVHHVSLDRTPELWARLEQDEITLREACGNTVRNITASPEAGIAKDELFDVSPYAHALFNYLLRKPFGQELGRKIKIAFSHTDADSAYTFMHCFGFIPRVQQQNGTEVRGFKVLVGGGLGAQPILAKVAFEFLPTDQLIPFVEAGIRVFDRYGERVSRHKARLKYLVQKIGIEEFLKLVDEERQAVLHKSYPIDPGTFAPYLQNQGELHTPEVTDDATYHSWLITNTFAQKQNGFYGVYVKIRLGDISSADARKLAALISAHSHDDARITINQGFLLRFVPGNQLHALYQGLKAIGLHAAGFDSVADITACPGTDTCNLAISSSTHISVALEEVVYNEYAELIHNKDIRIKISGCMNSCGQHGLAQIGFHGSSFKVGNRVVPALQLLLGGGVIGSGEGRTGDKIIKVASKRGPNVLRSLLDDYLANASLVENFNAYYDRQGKDYFYQLLKPLAEQATLTDSDFIDWGQDTAFQTAIGVGECAGVLIDLVATLFFEAEEKLAFAAEAFENKQYGDSVYYSYAAFISAAKALLLDKEVHVNTHHSLIADFDKTFGESGLVPAGSTFKELVLQINRNEPSPAFAEAYFEQASDFIKHTKHYRATLLAEKK